VEIGEVVVSHADASGAVRVELKRLRPSEARHEGNEKLAAKIRSTPKTTTSD
jgi:hypothetical protein